MAKVLFIQSFSPKIYELNDLTFNNHIKYFNKHAYSFIFKNETYNSGLFDFKGVAKYLDEFDIVVTLGCDCIITGFDTPIESFASNYISLSQESVFSYYCGTFCNGEILIFNKKGKEIYSIVESLDAMQQFECADFKSKNVESPTYFYSTQSLFNNIYSGKYQHSKDIRQCIDYLPIGKLQSYINDYAQIQVTPAEEWNPSRFLLHVFGIPNEKKIECITDFFNKHPQYK